MKSLTLINVLQITIACLFVVWLMLFIYNHGLEHEDILESRAQSRKLKSLGQRVQLPPDNFIDDTTIAPSSFQDSGETEPQTTVMNDDVDLSEVITGEPTEVIPPEVTEEFDYRDIVTTTTTTSPETEHSESENEILASEATVVGEERPELPPPSEEGAPPKNSTETNFGEQIPATELLSPVTEAPTETPETSSENQTLLTETSSESLLINEETIRPSSPDEGSSVSEETPTSTETAQISKEASSLNPSEEDMPSLPVEPETEAPLPPIQPETEASLSAVQPATEAPLPPIQPETEASLSAVQPATEAPLPPVQPATEASLQPAQPETEASLQPVQPETEASLQPVQPETEASLQPAQPETEASLQPVQPETEASLQPAQPETEASLQPVQPETEASLQPVQPETEASLQPVQPKTETSSPPIEPETEAPLPPVQPATEASPPPVQPETEAPLQPAQPETEFSTEPKVTESVSITVEPTQSETDVPKVTEHVTESSITTSFSSLDDENQGSTTERAPEAVTKNPLNNNESTTELNYINPEVVTTPASSFGQLPHQGNGGKSPKRPTKTYAPSYSGWFYRYVPAKMGGGGSPSYWYHAQEGVGLNRIDVAQTESTRRPTAMDIQGALDRELQRRKSIQHWLLQSLYQYSNTMANEIITVSKLMQTNRFEMDQSMTSSTMTEIQRLNRMLSFTNEYLQKLARFQEYDGLLSS